MANTRIDEVACASPLSRFSFAVNSPLPLRHLSSQPIHLMGIIKAVVLAKGP